MSTLRFLVSGIFLLISLPALAQDGKHNGQPFQSWLKELRKEALEKGISQPTLDEAFAETSPIPHIIELDRKQPETTLTLPEYLDKVVNPVRVSDGQDLMKEHEALLKEVSAAYGVQPEYIVALWGVETNFGSNTGGYQVVDALATLAYDGRRSEFFRGELLNALRIIDADHISAFDMKGSWAGAMGQCQFMPSSFLQYAVDFNNDGMRDIWGTQEDVFASIANYLSSSGWNVSTSWGAHVQLPEGFDTAFADIKQTKTFAEWKNMGIRFTEEQTGYPDDAELSLILAGSGDTAEPYLITNNYKVLLKWNRSRYFATAVGMIADQIKYE